MLKYLVSGVDFGQAQTSIRQSADRGVARTDLREMDSSHNDGEETVMGRAVVHGELMSRDPVKLASFYERIFGWKIEPRPGMNYHLVETGGNGGHQRWHSEAAAPGTLARQHDLLYRRR
jgi:hypothetical protein